MRPTLDFILYHTQGGLCLLENARCLPCNR